MIVELKPNDPRIREIAKLHAEQIPLALFSALGEDWLAAMYRCAAGHWATVIYAWVEGDSVLGFIAGTLDPPMLKLRLLLRLGPRTALMLLRKPWLIGRALMLAYVLAKVPSIGLPEELAIALPPEAQGKGIAKQLLDAWALRCCSVGCSHYSNLIASCQPQALAFYRKHGGVVTDHLTISGVTWSTIVLPC